MASEHFRVFVFVGAGQSKLPFDLAASLQRLGPRAEYIKVSGNGPNALDFHIAYYIGRLAASEPTAYFHIISKDTGFDPLIQHLRSNQILAGRFNTISEIPPLRTAISKSLEERLEIALARLQRMKSARPGRAKTLTSTIASLFQNQLSEEEVAALIQCLVDKGYIVIAEPRITYALPDDD